MVEDRSRFVYELLGFGLTTDVYMLPVGTTFRVVNGAFNAKIVEDAEGDKCVYVNDTRRSHKLLPNQDYKVVLSDIKTPSGG